MIRPVSSVNFKNNYKQSFSAKKTQHNDAKNNNMSNPSGMKRIVLPATTAILLLSPMNAVNAGDNTNRVENSERIELIQVPTEKVVAKAEFKNPSPTFPHAIVNLISTDNDDDTAEKVTVDFYLQTRVKHKINNSEILFDKQVKQSMSPDTLVVRNIDHINGEGKVFKKSTQYLMVGNGTFYSYEKPVGVKDNTQITNRQMKTGRREVEITQDFYNQMKDLLGDDTQYKTEKTQSEY